MQIYCEVPIGSIKKDISKLGRHPAWGLHLGIHQ